MAKPAHKVAVTECPDCDSRIRFHKPLKIGQIVNCPECDQRLVVEQLDPLRVDWALDDDYDDFDDDEDWD
jgi:lysine biosynthesis protein LysW